jgi:hypothetical protein
MNLLRNGCGGGGGGGVQLFGFFAGMYLLGNGIQFGCENEFRHHGVLSQSIFGSMCFVHVPKEIRPKASFKTTKVVEARLLGQEKNLSGWVVRSESTGRTVWSSMQYRSTWMIIVHSANRHICLISSEL